VERCWEKSGRHHGADSCLHRSWPWRAGLSGVLAALCFSGSAYAIDDTWNGSAPGEWTNAANWSGSQVPDGTATFATTGTTTVTNAGGSVSIGTVQFDPAAVPFTFTIVNPFTIIGNGIANDSANTQTFVNNSTLTLSNFAFSYGTNFTNNGAMIIRDFAQIITGTITNSGGGVLTFQDGASAVSSTINNSATVNFNDSAIASNALINNASGATVNFNNSTSADSATITNGGTLNFKDSSSAGAAGITNNSIGTINFLNAANAGGANIGNNGTLTFQNSSSAGGAFITNKATLTFSDSATAGVSTITTNNGATTSFTGTSTGGSAIFITNAGGTFDISGLSSAGTTAGSIEGAGSYVLGSKNLTTGSNDASTTVDGVISGSNGSLTKVGAGTMTLTAVNTYTGATTISGGTLALSGNGDISASSGVRVDGTFDASAANGPFVLINTLSGGASGIVTMGGNGLVIANGSTEFAGAINGTGGLEVIAGTQTLSGVNTYTNATQIDAGATLALKGDGSIASSLFVGFSPGGPGQTGTFDISQTTAGASVGALFDSAGVGVVSLGSKTLTITSGSFFNGVIQDGGIGGGTGGRLTIANGAVQQLGNTNTYTGATTIAAGGELDLFSSGGGRNGSIAASSSVTNDGIFDIAGLTTGGSAIKSLSGSTSGLVNLGSNTLTLTNANGVFSGAIQGGGGLVLAAGTQLLTGVNTYTGPTDINAGILSVDGSLVSTVNVNNGGTLVGNGSIGGLNVASGGIVSPGHSIGQVNVAGPVTFNAGSVYQVEANAAGQADKINAAGAATLNGGTVQVVAAQGNYALSTTYGILHATSVAGTFSSVTSNLFFLTASLAYTPTDVFLTLTRDASAFARQAQTPNQLAVGGALDASPFDSTLVQAIFPLTASQARQAFDRLSGEVHASTAGALVDESLYVRSAILGRLRQASYGGDAAMESLAMGGPQTSFADAELNAALGYAKSPMVTKAPLLSPAPSRDLVFWSQGFGAWGKFNSDGNAAALNRDLAGVITGFDARFGNWRGGIAAGYTNSRNNIDSRGSANVETGHVAAYGGASVGALNLRAGGAYAFHTIDTDRTINFPGFFDRATAHYPGGTGQVFGEAGYGFAFGKLAVEPFAGAAWVRFDTDAFSEKGGIAALNVAANSFEVGYSTLGVRAASLVPLDNGMVLIPRASAAWQHAFNSVTPAATMAFQSTGASFVVAGVPIARDSLLAEAGVDLAISRNATIGVSYTGQIASNVADHAAKGRFSWKFN
jgi:outer membrane autotransporter protein